MNEWNKLPKSRDSVYSYLYSFLKNQYWPSFLIFFRHHLFPLYPLPPPLTPTTNHQICIKFSLSFFFFCWICTFIFLIVPSKEQPHTYWTFSKYSIWYFLFFWSLLLSTDSRFVYLITLPDLSNRREENILFFHLLSGHPAYIRTGFLWIGDFFFPFSLTRVTLFF